MSEPEQFLDRWSRRKHGAADESAPVEAKDAAKVPPPPAAASKEPDAEAPFDPASLPPIESISANSDIRAFLRPGVPPDLSRAALRRAWSADPAIRDFIGLVENGWDFNDPNGMAGFGPIAADDVARLLAQIIGSPPAEAAAPQPLTSAQANFEQDSPPAIASNQRQQFPQDQPAQEKENAAPDKDFVRRNNDDAASQDNPEEREDIPPLRQRGHGGALPK